MKYIISNTKKPNVVQVTLNPENNFETGLISDESKELTLVDSIAEHISSKGYAILEAERVSSHIFNARIIREPKGI